MIGLRLFLALVVWGTAWFAAAQSAPGRLDPTFVPQGLRSGAWIYKIAVQPDNKILVIDAGFDSAAVKRYVRRLNPDGSEDTSFLAPEFAWTQWGPPPVSALALQNDRILVGGNFTNINGISVGGVIRLKADGTLDPTFNMGTRFSSDFSDNSYFINTLVVQPDGKIMVGGRFHTVNEQPMVHLARLNADGTVDPGFHSVISSVGASEVSAVLIEPEGSIITAGSFLVMEGVRMYGSIVRLRNDGALDSTFVSPESFLSGPFGLARDNSGRILLVSDASYATLKRLVRLQPNGQIDSSFDIGSGPNERLREVAVQPDGRIIVAGDFTTFAGKPRKGVARLNSDGSLDETFDTSDGPDYWVFSLALDLNNRVLIGGIFDNVEGSARPGLARLYGGDPTPIAPSIIEAPRPLSVEQGDNATLQVAALGYPLFFRWLRNGEIIVGATNSTLTIFNTTAAQAGAYRVAISNALGQVTSDEVDLQVTTRPAAANLILNSSFEETSANPSPPNSYSFYGVKDWTGSYWIDLFRYPSDVPDNFMGNQMVLHGSNYVGFVSEFYTDSFSRDYSSGGILTGRLAQATVPGGRYEMAAWFSRAELSESPEVGIEVLLIDGRGATLSLGQQVSRNSSGWERYHRTLITSKAYDAIIVQRAKAPSQGNQRGYVYLDKLSLTAGPDTPPVFAALPIQVAGLGQEISITNRVTDTDITDAALIYSLGPSSPKGMAIEPFSGIIHWRPGLMYGGSTNQVVVKAAYNGSEVLSGTTVVSIAVLDGLKLGLGEARLRAGESGAVPMVLDVYASPGVGLTNVSFRLQFPAHRLNNLTLTALHPSLGESSVMLMDQTNAVVICNVSPGQTLQGRQQLAELSFDAVSNQSSAFFSFGITEVVGLRHDGVKVARAFVEVGRVGIVGTEALMECGPVGGARSFKLYGPLGTRYRLESTTNLSYPAAWQAIRDITLTNFIYEITGIESNLPALFLRVRELP